MLGLDIDSKLSIKNRRTLNPDERNQREAIGKTDLFCKSAQPWNISGAEMAENTFRNKGTF